MRACKLLVLAGIANDENGRRSWRDLERTGGRIEGRSLDHVIGATPLDGVQLRDRRGVICVPTGLRYVGDR